MVKIKTLKEMNSCRNWHCCCHTIIPKKRRQDTLRQFRSPAKNLKLDLENEAQGQTGFEPAEVSNSPQFQNADEIENGEMAEGNTESECDESPKTEIVSNGNDNFNNLTGDESEIESDSLTLTINPSNEKEEAFSPEIKSESHDGLNAETDQELPPSENHEVELKEELTENTSVVAEVESAVTNGSSEDARKVETEDAKDIKTKVEVTTKIIKESTPKVAVPLPVTPKCVEIKDKEKPSTSTGASTGRYNCRNREKFHKCLKCGKMFFQLDSFVRHEKEHLLEETKPCYCTVCNRSYTSMSSFSRHLKTHITCVQCNKTFSQAEVGKVSPGGNNFHCSDCKKNSSPQPPVLQPEGPIKNAEAAKNKVESANHIVMNNGSTVYARKSVPVFIEKKIEPGTVVKKVKQLGLQPSHLKVSKDHSSFLKCNECDRRFPNLTTLKNHRTLHTTI